MSEQPKEERGITAIAVSGFKSLRDESRIEIRNLTVLAGANSSGKSSIMQPLLLLKQTLEAPYDPGPLKLDGPNVSFTEAKQFLINNKHGGYQDFQVEVGIGKSVIITNSYQLTDQMLSSQLELRRTVVKNNNRRMSIDRSMSREDILSHFGQLDNRKDDTSVSARVVRDHVFLKLDLKYEHGGSTSEVGSGISETLIEIIHVPGLRSTLKGAYPSAYAFDGKFAGTFDEYVGGVVLIWQEANDLNYAKLTENLDNLKLTSYIAAIRQNDVQIEFSVGRTLNSSSDDTVKIANVGLGVPQVLAVLVALLVAEPGQLVYIEQPELHLHPRAQVKLAEIIADAANRGVRVVIETHSDLLLRGIQTLVAEGRLATNKTILHWFTRDDEGVTHITSTELDENGAFGDWPQDFADVDFKADSDYLDAVEKRHVRD